MTNETRIDLATPEAHENAVSLSQGGRRLIRDLAAIRESRGLSKSAVADVIGINRSGITRFENQQSDPRLETILRYAHAVGATLNFVVGELSEPTMHPMLNVALKHAGIWGPTVEQETDSSTSANTAWFSGQTRRLSMGARQ